MVGEAGHLYVPNETAGGWAFRLAKDMDEGGWLDVQQLGTGEFFGLHGASVCPKAGARCARSTGGTYVILTPPSVPP